MQKSVPINTTYLYTRSRCSESEAAPRRVPLWKIPRFRSTRFRSTRFLENPSFSEHPLCVATCLDYMPRLHACLHACPHACRGLQRRHRVTPLVYVSLSQKRRQIADKSPIHRRSIDPPDRSLPRRSSRRLEEAGRGQHDHAQIAPSRPIQQLSPLLLELLGVKRGTPGRHRGPHNRLRSRIFALLLELLSRPSDSQHFSAS